MIYSNDDKHPIITALKQKGWVLFDVTFARATEKNGIHGGWWVDCSSSFGTEHYISHKQIDKKWLGMTLKDSLKNIKSDKFPQNLEPNKPLKILL